MMDMRKQLVGFQTILLYTIRKLLLSKRIYITLLIMLFIVAVMAYASTLDLTEQEIEDGVTKVDVGIEMLDGPLGPGNYRFTVTPSLADVVGNPLDGDGDGTDGDAYQRQFTINDLHEHGLRCEDKLRPARSSG